MTYRSLTTIGALIDADHKLAVYCAADDCRHNGWLDLEALAARLGRDHGSMHWDLAPKLKCSACGARGAAIRLHPPVGPFK